MTHDETVAWLLANNARERAYLARIAEEQAAIARAEAERCDAAARAWNMHRDMLVAAGDWLAVARMDA